MNIQWTEDVALHIGEIDDQHKKIFTMINALYKAISKGSDKSDALDALKDMADYAIEHFSKEERYMRQAGYPHMDEHKSEHDDFFSTLEDFEKRYKTGDVSVEEISGFLNGWIENHIMGTDRGYVPFFKDMGIR